MLSKAAPLPADQPRDRRGSTEGTLPAMIDLNTYYRYDYVEEAGLSE